MARQRDAQGRFVSKSTHGRGIQQTVDPGERLNRPIASVVQTQQSFVRSVARVLRNSDVAFRRDRTLQREMRRDPDIMAPLLQRQMAVALLEWEIVPQDENDETQAKQAEELDQLIRDYMPHHTEFIRNLLDAIWYGPAANNVIYSQLEDGRIAPVDWMPFHSDTIQFRDDGWPGLRVSQLYDGPTQMGPEGLVHLLDERERRAFVLHTHQRQGPDYYEYFDTAMAWRGRGVRDMIWYHWLLKQTIMQAWATYAERFASGIRIGYYPSGNASARAEMENILANLQQDVSVTLPRVPGEDDTYKIEILEPSGSNNQIYSEMVEWLVGKIKELVVGQTATSEATATGLGSDVGQRHAETFNRIIRYDAHELSESLTTDFVRVLHAMNFGVTPYVPRWKYLVDRIEPKEHMEAVGEFLDMGGRVPERHVREIVGVPEPESGEVVLERTNPFGPVGSVPGGPGGQPPGSSPGRPGSPFTTAGQAPFAASRLIGSILRGSESKNGRHERNGTIHSGD